MRPARAARTGGCAANSGQVTGCHLGGRVQLHRAGPERDHRAVERHVAVRQLAQVAQHLRLGAVRSEHRMRQEVARARSSAAGQRVGDVGVELVDRRRARRKARPDGLDLRALGGLVAGDADGVGVDAPRLTPRWRAAATTASAWTGTRAGACRRTRRARASTPPPRRPCGEDRGAAVHARRAIASRPSRPVVDRVHPAITASSTCAVQMLRRRLLAADVLLAGLQREAQRGCAVGVDRDADEPARAACARGPSRTAM